MSFVPVVTYGSSAGREYKIPPGTVLPRRPSDPREWYRRATGDPSQGVDVTGGAGGADGAGGVVHPHGPIRRPR
jgi:hypothetical protein